MGKIKELLAKQKIEVKEIFIKYIATIIAVFLFCLVAIYEVDKAGNGGVVEQLMIFFAIFACGSFFIETIFRNNGIIMYVADTMISLLLTVLVYNLEDWVSSDVLETFLKYFALYFIIILGTSFYVIIKKSGMSFQGYINTVGLNYAKWGAIFAVLNVGILIIFEIFNSLIVKIDIYEFWARFELLLLGILYFPYALICITPKNEEKPKFIRAMIRFLLVPLLIVAMLIIYIYIFKILFIGSVPSNEVFGICAGVFSIGFVISTLAYAYMDEEVINDAGKQSIYDKIILYIKYGFIPTVLLEIYAIGIRVADYGMTGDRYIGVVFIIAQIIYIAWEPINKLLSKIGKTNKKEEIETDRDSNFNNKTGIGKGYEKLIFVAIIIYIFAVIVPFTNIEYTCYVSQKNRMEKALDENDYVTAYSALRIIKYNRYGKKYLDENYSTEEIKKIKENYVEDNKGNNYYSVGVYISPNYQVSEIDIADYSRMYTFSVNKNVSFTMDNANMLLVPQNISDVKNEDKLEIRDLRDIINDALSDYGYGEEKTDYDAHKAREYVFDNKKIIIRHISFRYNEDEKTVENFSMDGFLLIK